MKPQKNILMECPNCKVQYGKEPFLEIQPDGSMIAKERDVRKCGFCGTNTQRKRVG